MPNFIFALTLSVASFLPLIMAAGSARTDSFPARGSYQTKPGVVLPTNNSPQSNRGDGIERHLLKHEKVTLDVRRVADAVRRTGRLSLETTGRKLELALEPAEMRASGYRAESVGEDGVLHQINPGPVGTFRGRVLGREDAEARLTIDDTTVEGLIILGSEKYYLEPAARLDTGASKKEFLFYKDSDVKRDAAGLCSVLLDEKVNQAVAEVSGTSSKELKDGRPQSEVAPPLNLDIEVATEADYEFVQAAGGAAAANREILGLMNLVDGVYQRDLGISLTIVYQHTWETAADPYSSTNSSTALMEFQTYWNNNLSGVSRDLAHMWTGKDLDGSFIGTAFLGSLCNEPSRAYSLSERLFGSDLRVGVIAHEIGHNLGATHPDEEPAPVDTCLNTIMQSAVGYSQVFCQFSRDQMTAYINRNKGCLTPTFSLSGRVLNFTYFSEPQVTLSGDKTRQVVVGPNGAYTFRGLRQGGTYTVTPSRPFHSFNPPSYTITNLSGDQTEINFNTIIDTFSISGRVAEADGRGAAGVQMILSTAASVEARLNTDANGDYKFVGLPALKVYTIDPYSPDYSFTPPNKSLPPLTANQTGLNFIATSRQYRPPSGTIIPSPPPSTVAGRVVYQRGFGTSGISVINADGTGQSNLTDATELDSRPVWSPDGTRIAFTRGHEGIGTAEIYVMNADGSNVKNLTNNPKSDYLPRWSPDGQKILFISYRNGGLPSPVYIMDADGSNQTVLPFVRSVNTPDWSPDGKKFAYHIGSDNTAEIHIVNIDGSNDTRIATQAEFPAWSPDGTRIAFTSTRDGNPEIYVMNADGSAQKRLTNYAGLDYSPRWSPDGRKIGFISERDGTKQIYVMNADGSGPWKLTSEATGVLSLSWHGVSTPLGFNLLTEDSSGKALALESVTARRAPLSVINQFNFSLDQRNRVSLFALNLDFLPSDGFNVLKVQGEDAAGKNHLLPVEYVGRVSGLDWLTQIIILLPDGLPAGEFKVSVNWQGRLSSQVSLVIK